MKTNTRKLTRIAAIFAIVWAALLAGCTHAPTHYDRQRAVEKSFEGEVETRPGWANGFFVKDESGSLWYVKTDWEKNDSDQVYVTLTERRLLFK